MNENICVIKLILSHSDLEKSCQSGLLSNKYALQVRVAGKTNYTWFVCQF